METGKIKSFDVNTGDGMITPSKPAKDVYFNEACVQGGTGWLDEGKKCQFERDPENPQEARVVRPA